MKLQNYLLFVLICESGFRIFSDNLKKGEVMPPVFNRFGVAFVGAVLIILALGYYL